MAIIEDFQKLDIRVGKIIEGYRTNGSLDNAINYIV